MSDPLQGGAWLIAIVGGAIGGVKALGEMRASRALREEELRWRKAGQARELLVGIQQSQRVRDVYKMLEWDGREYNVAPGVTFTLSQEQIYLGLRTHNEGPPFDGGEAYVRDCFDTLLDEFAALEHHIRRGLVDFEDVRYPFEYYIGKMLEAPRDVAIERYMRFYDSTMADAFIGRFRELSSLHAGRAEDERGSRAWLTHGG